MTISINTTNVSKKKRRSIMLVKLYISIAIKKAILSATILIQKTSISFGNLCTIN